MSTFRYVHRAAFAAASLREREASRAFACARERGARAAAVCVGLCADDAALRADVALGLRESNPCDLAKWLVVGERALGALAQRRGAARDALAASDARLALARAELARCVRKREAFARHRAAAEEAHALAVERADETAGAESAALAYGARVRLAGSGET